MAAICALFWILHRVYNASLWSLSQLPFFSSQLVRTRRLFFRTSCLSRDPVGWCRLTSSDLFPSFISYCCLFLVHRSASFWNSMLTFAVDSSFPITWLLHTAIIGSECKWPATVHCAGLLVMSDDSDGCLFTMRNTLFAVRFHENLPGYWLTWRVYFPDLGQLERWEEVLTK